MKIETKFDIGNLVVHKFDTPKRQDMIVFEVLEHLVQICYGGVQIFHFCRPIYILKIGADWHVTHGRVKDESGLGMMKLREDEIIQAPQKYIDIILNRGQEASDGDNR